MAADLPITIFVHLRQLWPRLRDLTENHGFLGIGSVVMRKKLKDGTGHRSLTVCLFISADFGIIGIVLSIQVVRSLIHKSLSKFKAVCGGYS